MYVIAGLGNPDKKYDKTRHNAGFDALDVLSERYRIPVKTKKFRSLIGLGTIGAEKVILVKPQTYMNLSGEAIRAVVEYYHVPVSNVIVLCDDIDLPVGVLRIRPTGSAGSHNGLKNIILELADQGFPRIRIGAGFQPENEDRIQFVLSGFSPEDRRILEKVFENAADAVRIIMESGTAEAMNRLNGKREE